MGPTTGHSRLGRPSVVDITSSGCWASAAWGPSIRPGMRSSASTVAIKVIRPEVMADPKTAAEIERRFKRELLLARQVTHRNVVRIHDLGDIGGIKYITMSYVDGADLASVLKQEGRLSPVRRSAHRALGRFGPRRSAQSRRRPSRPQAGQHHDRRRGPGVDHGLRHRPVDWTADGRQVPGNTTIVGQPAARRLTRPRMRRCWAR